jgi:endoribonuclease Dicer
MKIRYYQLELLEKAIQGNVIVYLDTGSGKTLIAIHLIMSFPSGAKVVFLAPTNALVNQQATVIKQNLDLRVMDFSWDSKSVLSRNQKDWRKLWNNYDVFAMTPQILLNTLQHGYFFMDEINLLILDEAHHAQGSSPYSAIMTQYYQAAKRKPKIFGMTASPLKNASRSMEKMEKGLTRLEQVLNSKIVSISESETTNSNFNKADGIERFN